MLLITIIETWNYNTSADKYMATAVNICDNCMYVYICVYVRLSSDFNINLINSKDKL